MKLCCSPCDSVAHITLYFLLHRILFPIISDQSEATCVLSSGLPQKAGDCGQSEIMETCTWCWTHAWPPGPSGSQKEHPASSVLTPHWSCSHIGHELWWTLIYVQIEPKIWGKSGPPLPPLFPFFSKEVECLHCKMHFPMVARVCMLHYIIWWLLWLLYVPKMCV